MMRSPVRALATVALALFLSSALAEADPPARVGRLGLIENDVEFRVDRSSPPMPATGNWPLSSGASLTTGDDGRVEAWIGSTAYRIAEDSEIEFPRIDDARVEVRVRQGSLTVSVLDRDQADDIELSMPEGSVRFVTPGRYRIDVDGAHSELRVQAGRAVFDDGRQVTQVSAGQRYAQWDDGNSQFDADRGADAFDRWVAGRESGTYAATARRYVSPHMTGYQDLDLWGDWRSAPEYGAIWYPRAVADDWAPYRHGRWAWIEPWGWTWIDQAPWGFAPFHYGRWVLVAGRWGWVPGRPSVRPVYAPALVGWLGEPGWRVSFSFGAAPAVGWFPLAPREVYVPTYRYSPTYVRRINVMHVHDVTVIDRRLRDHAEPRFAYRGAERAVTVAPVERVRGGQPISPRELPHRVTRELERAPVASRAPTTDWLAPPPRVRNWAPDGHDGRGRGDGERRMGRPHGQPGLAVQPVERSPRPERRQVDESRVREAPGGTLSWPSPSPAAPRVSPEISRESPRGRDSERPRERRRDDDARSSRRGDAPGVDRPVRESAPAGLVAPEVRPAVPRDTGRREAPRSEPRFEQRFEPRVEQPRIEQPRVEPRFEPRRDVPRDARPEARGGEGRRHGRDDDGRDRGGR